MDNPRPEKVAVVAEVKEKLENSSAVVLTEYRGMNVSQMAELRKALAEAGGEYKVYKNTLTRFAANELDLDLDELLTGPTALAFATERADGTPGDATTISKAIVEFNKTNENLIIKGGVLDGEILGVDKVQALAKVPPREELLARLAGGMAAPMQKFAALLAAMPREMAGLLKALIDAGGAPGAPADAPAAAEEAPAEEAAADDAAAADAPAEEAAAEEAPAEEAAEAPAADLPAGAALPNEDGSAPDGFTVKGNADSMKYHTTDSAFYDRTVAEIWFDSAESAEAAGYTAPGGAATSEAEASDDDSASTEEE